MKLQDLLKHTQNFIKVRIEECGQTFINDFPSVLLDKLPACTLSQTVGLIKGASDKQIKVSIIPRKK